MNTTRDKKKQVTCDNSRTRLLPETNSRGSFVKEKKEKKKKGEKMCFLPFYLCGRPIKVRSSESRVRRQGSKLNHHE